LLPSKTPTIGLQTNNHSIGSLIMLAVTARRVSVCDVGCYQGSFRHNGLELQRQLELAESRFGESAPTFLLAVGPYLGKKADITDHCPANFMEKEGRQSQGRTVMRVVVYVFGFLNLALVWFIATH
jgi:hypothetical protein